MNIFGIHKMMDFKRLFSIFYYIFYVITVGMKPLHKVDDSLENQIFMKQIIDYIIKTH